MWSEGSSGDKPTTDLETWFIPCGNAVAMLYDFKQPSLHGYLSHNLMEAILVRAVAHANVTEGWNDGLMVQVQAAGAIRG